MGKWTTPDFIHAFMDGKLGRKRVHGTYRVLDGDHCKLLVRATIDYGRPAGNLLVAINLSDENTKLVFWQKNYNNNFTYRMSKNIGSTKYQCLPELMLTGDEEGLLNSGIVETSDAYTLIELGDKPFLLNRDVEMHETGVKGAQTVTQKSTSGECHAFAFANQVSARVPTIAAAKELVKDPEDERRLVGVWWAKEMEFGFVPPPFEPENVKILSAPLNPLDFGFEMDECKLGSISSTQKALRAFVPKDSVLKVTPSSAKVDRWQAALVKWSNAADKLVSRTPITYKGISINSSKYVYSGTDDTVGDIICTAEGVFVKGTLHDEAHWNHEDTLTQWFKLTVPANQINIPRISDY